jgi:hypothetical protein
MRQIVRRNSRPTSSGKRLSLNTSGDEMSSDESTSYGSAKKMRSNFAPNKSAPGYKRRSESRQLRAGWPTSSSRRSRDEPN